ncbi:MAG: signal recognition particle-docking protein FtsY [Candidatus Limnocylindrales bacterium]
MFWRRRPRDDESATQEVVEEPVGAETADMETAAPSATPPADDVPAPAAQPLPPAEPVPPAEPALIAEPVPALMAEPVHETPRTEAETEAVVEAELAAGLTRTRGGFMHRLRGILGGGDATDWDEVEETLIGGDVGAALAMRVVERARARHDPAGGEAAIRAELAGLLVPRDGPWEPRPGPAGGPAVILVIGVNGTGKTTTIGKLAARYRAAGRSVLLAAADTFRAAAIEQLQVWATRSGATVVAHAPGADPGAVVYDALDAAVARRIDLVIADTAGRLHTKVNLMDELAKVRRIIDKRLPGCEPETLFVLDATTGQNGLSQATAFHQAVGITGIVLTKLDSTAKGGIVFAIEDSLRVPVRFVGVGEGVGDLIPFDPTAFVEALFD